MRRKIIVAAGVLVFVPFLAILVYGYAYEPLKYHYLVRRVELAHTAAEERAAFTLAADWGRVWEVERLQASDMVVRGRKLSGDWLLRLEWLPSSPYGGGAYTAYRRVIDTNNVLILWDKKY